MIRLLYDILESLINEFKSNSLAEFNLSYYCPSLKFLKINFENIQSPYNFQISKTFTIFRIYIIFKDFSL